MVTFLVRILGVLEFSPIHNLCFQVWDPWERVLLNICTGKWKTRIFVTLFSAGTCGPQTLRQRTKSLSRDGSFGNALVLPSQTLEVQFVSTEASHDCLHLPTSQAQASFPPWDVSKAYCNTFLSVLRACNQGEPVCSGWLLTWPWPSASGLFLRKY